MPYIAPDKSGYQEIFAVLYGSFGCAPDWRSEGHGFDHCQVQQHSFVEFNHEILFPASLGGSVGCASDWRPRGCRFDPRRGRQHSFVEIDLEIFSTVILSLPLIQEGQLSVSGKKMCTILVNKFRVLSLPSKPVVR